MNKLREAARQVVANGVQGTYAKYYSVPPADFESLREALAEQAEQRSDSERMEPVAWWDGKETAFFEHELYGLKAPAEFHIPLYAIPVRTKDLTDSEIADIGTNCGTSMWSLMFARAVIAADRELNK